MTDHRRADTPTAVVERAIVAYAEERSNDPFQEAQAVLDRHGAAWLYSAPRGFDDCSSPIRSMEDRDSIADYTAFEKYLKGVDCIPFFYRMQFLRQLSTVVFTSHLGATHTRFSHSIGATKIAAQMLDWIQRMGPDEEAKKLTHFDITAALFYCFIHDAFHGAFGHVLDLMKDVFDARPVEKLDTLYLREALSAAIAEEEDPIASQLRRAADLCSAGQGLALLRRVKELADPSAVKRERPGQYFLRELTSSVLDADRIDYLIRDSFYLDGQNHRQRFEALVASARALPYGDTVRLAFSERQKHTAAWALGLRRKLSRILQFSRSRVSVFGSGPIERRGHRAGGVSKSPPRPF